MRLKIVISLLEVRYQKNLKVILQAPKDKLTEAFK
jgi:hypothetical protein